MATETPVLLRALGAGLVLHMLALAWAGPAGAAVEDFDFESTNASVSVSQAGSHPDFVTTFILNGDSTQEDTFGQPAPWGGLRDLSVKLPAGMVGNPNAFPTCAASVFVNSLDAILDPTVEQCPIDSQVGLVEPGLWGFGTLGSLPEPLYNLESPGGNVVARMGFFAVFYPVFIDVRVDPERDNALTASIVNSPSVAGVTSARTTIWGVPADSRHDGERLTSLDAATCQAPCEGPTASNLPWKAFMIHRTSCGAASVGFEARNYQSFSTVPVSASLGETTGCESVPFEPEMSLRPTTGEAASPSGVDVRLTVPQDGMIDPNGLGSAHLKKAIVTLPEGVSLNASAASGLGSCSEAQIGLTSTTPIRFNASEPQCPSSSRVGTVKIGTPVLDDPLEGSLYLAKQNDNPFDSLLAGYMVARGKGVTIKQAGRFDLDPATGRIVAVFDNNPQLPFDDLQLHFKGGSRGVITTPSSCGTYTTDYQLTSWSAGPPVNGVSKFSIDSGPGGTACPMGGLAPKLNAGSAIPIAGEASPFGMRLFRDDGSGRFDALDLAVPPGLTAVLRGVPYCPESGLAAAMQRSGAAEQASPACPPASLVGAVSIGVGAGSVPYFADGRAYLAGPYKGAPLSLAVVVPAVAGPFDLGTVVVRSALSVDPRSARVAVHTDPLPRILQGIPLNVRDIRVTADRPDFVINPTNCREMAVDAVVRGGSDAVSVSNRFQVGACAALGFKPRLDLKLIGGVARGSNPKLRAELRARPGDANIANAAIGLPSSTMLDQSNIRTVCTRVQFAARACPQASIYGRAVAFTPLLDEPLSGPVYLRSSSNELPDLVAMLRGPEDQPIEIELAGRIDSARGGLRTTFDLLPDAPATKFVLTMKGGESRGLLVNSRNICARGYRAAARFNAQNGRKQTLRPLVRNARCEQ